MGNLKEIRNRIASVNSTQKITSAMKLVSAAKLRRAQTAIVSLRPYANKLNEMLRNLSVSSDDMGKFPLFEKREPEKVLIVVITSNRGLCGSFNSNIIKEVHHLIAEKYHVQQKNGNLSCVCIGKKGYDQLRRSYQVVDFNETLLETPSLGELSVVAEKLMQDFLEKKVDKIEIVYNQFVNAATQKITVAPFLPIQSINSEDCLNITYIFEPSKDEILTELIPKMLKMQLFKALMDSIASEHGARMTSMAKATDNASDMLKDLKLKYNNARQASITNELLEIISGANALDN